MVISTSGEALIRHSGTGGLYAIQPEDLEWTVDGVEERDSGPETFYSASIDHPELGPVTWELYEYPAGVENDQSVDAGPHAVLQNFTIRLNAGSDEEDRAEREARVEAMVEWFFQNFEDPANSMPYVSAEGGYQWIEGPFSAQEQLQDQFDTEDEDLIQDAVRRIESGGIVDWAPTHPYDESEPDLGELSEDLVLGEPITRLDDVDAYAPADISDAELSRRLAAVARPATGPVFGARGDQIDLVDWTRNDQPDPVLREELRETAAALAQALAGTNAHTDLAAQAGRYLETASQDPLSIARLYARGILLENTARVVAAEVREGERPPVPAAARTALGALLDLHGAVIMSTEEGRRLAGGAAQYQRSADGQAAQTEATLRLADALDRQTGLLAPQAREALREAASQSGAGPRPDRSNQLSGLILGGLLAGVALVARETATQVIVNGLAGVATAAGATAAITTGGNAALEFLVENVQIIEVYAGLALQDRSWLQPLVAWIRARTGRT